MFFFGRSNNFTIVYIEPPFYVDLGYTTFLASHATVV